MNHILTVLRIPAERASGFIALGEMAGALDGELIHYLPTIMSHLRDAVGQILFIYFVITFYYFCVKVLYWVLVLKTELDKWLCSTMLSL